MISQKTKSTLTVAIGTILVVLGTLFLVALASGYNINIFNFEITSFGLIKLNSNPSGATVKINSRQISQKTPYQLDNVKPGEVSVEYLKDGYRNWFSKYNVVGGVVTFADYALLIPKLIDPKTIESDIKSTSLVSSGNNNKLFALSPTTGSIFEITGSQQLKKLVDLPLNDSIKQVSNLTEPSTNQDGSAMLLKASYPDSKAVNFWIGLSNGNVVNVDSIFAQTYSQATIDPRNARDVFALIAGQLVRANTENKTLTKLGASNINTLFVDRSYIYTLENRNPASAGQVLIRYDHNGNNRMQIMEFAPFKGSPWGINSAKLGGIDYLTVLEPSSGELSVVRMDGDKVSSSVMGQNCSQANFNEKGRFLSFYQSKTIRTVDLEFIERFSTDVENVISSKWFTDYQILFTKPDGIYIVDYNGYNISKLPPETEVPSNLQYSFTSDNKAIYYIKDGKIYYYSLQPKSSLINF